jgi:hypothetical protein
MAAAARKNGLFEIFSNKNNENGRGPLEYTTYEKLNSAAASVQQMIDPEIIPCLAPGIMTRKKVVVQEAPSERALSSMLLRSIDSNED